MRSPPAGPSCRARGRGPPRLPCCEWSRRPSSRSGWNAIANLAILYERWGAPHLAEPLRRELVELRRKSSGPGSLVYADELGWLAQDLLDQKKYAEAEPPARESLAICAKSEPDHW